MNHLTILGGGPAGLSVAYYAARAGLPFVLFERADELGGMCRTFRHGAHRYDCGAHRFHDRDPEVTRDVYDLLGGDLHEVTAPSKVWERGRFIDFPPTPRSVIFSGGLLDAFRIGSELMRVRASHRPIVSFEDFALGQFGETLSRRILLNYSEKLWGRPARELSPDVATRRLQGMNLRSLFTSMVFPARTVRHLDGSFLYPTGGYGRISEALAGALPSSSIHTGREVVRVEFAGNRISRIGFDGGKSYEPPDRVVSTLPIGRVAAMIADRIGQEARDAAARLLFRHIRLIVVFVARPGISNNASIYVPDPRFLISRLYEPRNRSEVMAPFGETSLVAEIPCFKGDSIFGRADKDLAEIVLDELSELGLVKRSDVLGWKHHMLPNAYPVYTLDYAENVAVLMNAMRRISNLDILGRAGRFHYSHLHDHLRLGKSYVESLSRCSSDNADSDNDLAAQGMMR